MSGRPETYVVNPTNFISSIGEGKRVADLIDKHLRGTRPRSGRWRLTRVPTEFLATPNRIGRGRNRRVESDRDEPPPGLGRRLRWRRPAGHAGRCHCKSAASARGDTTLEVEVGLTKPIGFEEAKRCLQCQLNIFIDGNRCISATAASMPVRTDASR